MCTLVGGLTYRTQNSSDSTEPFDIYSIWNGQKFVLSTIKAKLCYYAYIVLLPIYRI